MADVGDDERYFGKPLPAAVKAGAAGGIDKAFPDAFEVGETLEAGDFLQDVDDGEHGAEVLFLRVGLQVHLLEDVLTAVPEGGLDLVRIGQRAHHPGLVVKDRRGLGMTLAHQRGNAGLEDAGLLPRDGREGIAQLGAMVQADGRDNAQFRRDHIRRIQPSAEPDLDDRHVHFLIREPLESQAGSNLEERQPMFDEIGLPLHEEVEDVFLGNQGERLA